MNNFDTWSIKVKLSSSDNEALHAVISTGPLTLEGNDIAGVGERSNARGTVWLGAKYDIVIKDLKDEINLDESDQDDSTFSSLPSKLSRMDKGRTNNPLTKANRSGKSPHIRYPSPQIVMHHSRRMRGHARTRLNRYGDTCD